MLLLLPALSFGENLIEVDLDGVFGNGPDTLTVPQGTPVTITIWFDGDVLLLAFAVAACGLDSANVALAEHLSTWWINNIPLNANGCVLFVASTIDILYLPLPSAVAEITYVANLDPGVYPIEIDPLQSYWYDNSLNEVTIDSFIPGYLLVTEATSTSVGSWGDVKNLFR